VELFPPEVIVAISKVLTFGAKKYTDENWRQGIKYKRVYGALQRHLMAWYAGQENDNETGMSHLWHAGCCLTFLIYYHLDDSYACYDDRFIHDSENIVIDKLLNGDKDGV
jgi:hypothetical protein